MREQGRKDGLNETHQRQIPLKCTGYVSCHFTGVKLTLKKKTEEFIPGEPLLLHWDTLVKYVRASMRAKLVVTERTIRYRGGGEIVTKIEKTKRGNIRKFARCQIKFKLCCTCQKAGNRGVNRIGPRIQISQVKAGAIPIKNFFGGVRLCRTLTIACRIN